MPSRRGIPGVTRLARGKWLAALVALAVGGGCDKPGEEAAGGGGEVHGSGSLADNCEVVPPFTPNFEPELQWAWTGSEVLPEFNQVMMTPAVVDVNQDGIPDIIFSSFRDAPGDELDWKEGVLRAISGDDGHDLWTVTDPAYRIKGAASITVGDIDNDGKVEICGIPYNGRGIICYENDGAFKFRTAEDALDYNEWGGPSLADLDGDGTVEILDGNRVYSNTGELKWVGSDGMGGAQYTGPVSFAADIDGDGKQEVINGRSVYRFDGSLKCAATTLDSGLSAVGNFDADPQGEIVVSGFGKVSLLDDDCTVLWSKDIPGGCINGCGGAPTIADLDHDDHAEIAVVGENSISVFEADGALKWTSTVQDWSSGKSGSSAFDFEDDGQLELVYTDEVSLRIYDGATGAVRFETRHSTGTTHENPVIADVDGDLAADIVVAANDLAYPPYHGIRVYHDRLEGWARTRGVWNQHAYSITNVNNDGSIPAHPVSHWLKPKLNTFHSNVANYFGDGPSPFAAPDLAVTQAAGACDGAVLSIGANVVNQGGTPVAAGLKVAFYLGNPASGGSLLGVTTVTGPIAAGESTFVSLLVSRLAADAEIFIVADDDGTGAGRDLECIESNNSGTAVTVGCGSAPDGGTGGDGGSGDGGTGNPDGGTGGDGGSGDGGTGNPDGGTGGDGGTGNPDGGTGGDGGTDGGSGGGSDGGCDHGGGGGGHDGDCGHDHDHDGDCDHDHDHDGDGDCDHDHDHDDDCGHDHDHDGHCDHNHDHDGDGDCDHDHDHDGNCGHDHDHHGGCGHDHNHDGHCDHGGHHGGCNHGGGGGNGGGGGGNGGGGNGGGGGGGGGGGCNGGH
ncbi:FG-GAP repeat domain-containing protein [Hyalangium versicolor]|uniref:FG-GAP repeat domain-containing protein n=1 Tax=Hyalangium versicolor TaxID=2861190 RepID=UPI001CCEE727|nr:VCBS repeat-containing protein [Hyalangium versicolor]